ncbi:MAG TPA: DUF3180 domain-containing protein [Kineosporiaceae bacterium]|nr:DUF3180 domain-containing protein [Kineosporiaceae bacterium]
MTPARVLTALLIALVSVTICWVGLDIWTGSGGDPLPLSWSAVVGTVALVVVVIAAGLPVRRWVNGRRDRPIDPLVAARTAVLAKASAYGGAALVGWYLSQGLLLLPDLVGARRERFAVALVAAAAAVGVSVAGFVVQRWCRIPPDDDETPGSSDSSRNSVR